MKQIEDGLYELHAKSRAQKEVEQPKDDVDDVAIAEQPMPIKPAFARVDRVDVGSPAHQAVGIKRIN